MKKKLIVGNWKLNPESSLRAKTIFLKIKRAVSRTSKTSVVICPSPLHLMMLAKLSRNVSVSVGVQDIFSEEQGAYTGQISAQQAYDAGAMYAILGHSEKRVQGDTNEIVAKKLYLATKSGMTAILCVGEKERDREGNFFANLKDQILSSLGSIVAPVLSRSVIIAYEPVWEVGRADMQTMKPSDIHSSVIFIRKVINDVFGSEVARAIPILYGGSVTTLTASSVVYDGAVDGLLVGRQSLDPDAFREILSRIDAGNYGSKKS